MDPDKFFPFAMQVFFRWFLATWFVLLREPQMALDLDIRFPPGAHTSSSLSALDPPSFDLLPLFPVPATQRLSLGTRFPWPPLPLVRESCLLSLSLFPL